MINPLEAVGCCTADRDLKKFRKRGEHCAAYAFTRDSPFPMVRIVVCAPDTLSAREHLSMCVCVCVSLSLCACVENCVRIAVI